MFIDIHAHCYRVKAPWMPFCTPEELIAEFDKYGIEKGVVQPIVSPEIYMPQANEDILEMCAKYPDRLIPFCNIDPRAMTNSSRAPLWEIIRAYKQLGCKGIGEVMPNMPLMDPLIQNLFCCAEQEGMSITYDGSTQIGGDFGLYDDPGLPQLEYTLQTFPDLIIFGHGPVFWSEIAKLETPAERGVHFSFKGQQICNWLPNTKIKEEGVLPKLFRRYPNLYGDLSDFTAYNAFARDEEYGPKFMEEFQDRLFFGTDMCFPGMEVALPGLMIRWCDEGRISETVFRKIARENAVRFLGLEG